MSRVALITGASSGIGRGLALRLAAHGYRVGLAARRPDLLEAVAAEIAGAGGTAAVLPCDVSDRDQVREAVERCRRELGPIDLLVANAGVSESTLVDRLDAGEVERLTRVNYFGVVYAVEAVLPAMLERGSGHLVGVSSLAGVGALPMTAAYSAAKSAVTRFLESVRLDTRDRGIAVTVVFPGYVRTAMTAQNLHVMPFLVELDRAVELIHEAIEKRRRSLMFPWPLAWLVWLGQIFPRRFYDWLATRVPRSKAGEREHG